MRHGPRLFLWIALFSCAASLAGCERGIGGGSEGFFINFCDTSFSDCGPDGECGTNESGNQVCLCNQGAFHAGPSVCAVPQQLSSADAEHCSHPSHCAELEVCERLEGACVPLDPSLCGVEKDVDVGGQGEGDFCVRLVEVVEPEFCGALDQRNFCRPGLACTQPGPIDNGSTCGMPSRRPGVCRKACDPCLVEPGCPDHHACFLVAGAGRCLPTGFVELHAECGELPCRPGLRCHLTGQFGGLASGTCLKDSPPAE